jgi:hypothetical protein
MSQVSQYKSATMIQLVALLLCPKPRFRTSLIKMELLEIYQICLGCCDISYKRSANDDPTRRVAPLSLNRVFSILKE